MRKIISIIMMFIFAMSFMTGCSAADEKTNETAAEKFVLTLQIGKSVMTVNGEEKNIDDEGTMPIIENGRTLVPIRAIIEAMGGKAAWDEASSTATLTLGDDSVALTIGSLTAVFNGSEKQLDTAPKIINGRTMLPIRFIAESLRFDVQWNGETQTITITKDALAAPDNADTEKSGKTLVVYYSATGSTERIANYIKNATNADIFKLELIDEYTSSDLDWTDSSSRVNAEHDDESKRDIALKGVTVPNFDEYDTVFIGYPIWWGIAAWPVDGFVKANDFTGKKVIPFCTSASSGMGESGKLLAEMTGSGDWQEGARFRSSASEDDVKAWAEELYR